MPPKNTTLPQCNRSDAECPHGTAIIELREDMRTVKKALVGDLETGKPGLVDEVRNLKAARKSDETAKNRWKGIAFGGVGAFVTAAGAWAWGKLSGKN